MNKTTKTVCELIRLSVCASQNDKLPEQLTLEEAKNIYSLAKSHDLVHLLSTPIEQYNLSPSAEASEKFRMQKFSAIYRSKNISYELERISATLEEARVKFIPLKGAIIRHLYPESWMRTSCDIDILVSEDDIDRAETIIASKLSYTRKWKNNHEVSLFSAGGVHLELHYHLVGDSKREAINSVLNKIPTESQVKEGRDFEQVLSDAMFYFYHIAHMALHFENGGCGMRPFLDLWLLNHRVENPSDRRRELLEKGGLLKFADAVTALSEVWFGKEEHTPLTEMLERYIISGGTYGNTTNSIKLKQTKNGGKFSYIISRIWLPYDRLRFRYPSLDGKRILTPFYQLRRWCGLLLGGKAAKAKAELRYAQNITIDEQKNMSNLLSELGL